MKKSYLLYYGVRLFSCLLILLSFSCVQKKPTPLAKAPVKSSIKHLAVFPFKDQAALKGENVLAQCNVCSAVFTTGNVADGAATFITKKTTELIRQKDTVSIVSNDRLNAVRTELLMDKGQKGLPPIEFMGALGAGLGADVVLSGNVYRFQQRIGSSLSVEKPASVGFDVYLVDTKLKKLIWHRQFDESQKSLSENLFKINTFIKRKGKWLTAEDLAEYGLKEILEKSPLP